MHKTIGVLALLGSALGTGIGPAPTFAQDRSDHRPDYSPGERNWDRHPRREWREGQERRAGEWRERRWREHDKRKHERWERRWRYRNRSGPYLYFGYRP
jgi:hypothetical protein